MEGEARLVVSDLIVDMMKMRENDDDYDDWEERSNHSFLVIFSLCLPTLHPLCLL